MVWSAKEKECNRGMAPTPHHIIVQSPWSAMDLYLTSKFGENLFVPAVCFASTRGVLWKILPKIPYDGFFSDFFIVLNIDFVINMLLTFHYN